MDFDALIDRSGTGALKWNAAREAGKADVVPLWVADMDFAAPAAVTEALRARVGHPIYGYTNPDPSYFAALRAWYEERYGARIEPSSVLLGPGVVPSIGIAVRAFSAAGEGVLIMPPVYYPFAEMVRDNGRVVVEAPLDAGNPFRMRFDARAAQAALDKAAAGGVAVKLAIFCSPHNPGGVVWKKEELASFLKFAEANDLIVLSDEIHGDLVFKPASFVSLAGFPGAAERTVVVSAPNKTFNLAGLHLSHFVAENDALRTRLKHGIAAAGYSQPNVLSLVAAQTAYERCGSWVDDLVAYLASNARYAAEFVNARVPGARTAAPDGTYLLWMDVSRLIAAKGLKDDRELVARLVDEARVRFTAGSVFVSGGGGFIRVNVACPRALLSEGLNRFASWASVV